MSKEYIEREEVLKHKRKMNSTDFSGEFWDEAVLCEDIWKIPKADVTEVRHGKWIKAGCSEKYGNANCSECGYWDWSDCNFCSNCGAKMDKE